MSEGEAPPPEPQWPRCQHRDSYGRACREDALGNCTICNIDACDSHMREWHQHKHGDPKFDPSRLALRKEIKR